MNYKHGKSREPIYEAWRQMLNRCTDPKNPKYPRYGGRGIKVCDSWLDFENFYNDMGDRPDGKTLDRQDNDKGYSPNNCRWATYSEQANNTSVVRKYEYAGVEQTLTELSKVAEVPPLTIGARINRGWSVKDAVETPAVIGRNQTDTGKPLPPSAKNKSGVVGVCWAGSRNKWVAQASHKGKRVRLYEGDSKEDAINARKQWEAEKFPDGG